MASINTYKFRVAIVGAGLGGLLLALFLQKNSEDIDVDVYEGAAELAEVGAGIGMWPRIIEIIRYLGLEEELVQITGANDRSAMPFYYRKSDQETEEEIFHFPGSFHAFHRSDLQHLLVRHLHSADKIHFSKRLASYTDPGDSIEQITLQFKDGTAGTCDLLIGSDGVRSAVRRTMFTGLANEADIHGDRVQAETLRAMVEPVYSGHLVYRSLIPVSKLAGSAFKNTESPHILCGKNKYIVTYPVSRGKTLNVGAFVYTPGTEGVKFSGPWSTESSSAEVTQQYLLWSDGVKDLTKAMETPSVWAIHMVGRLPTYVKGRVVLVGDAAHAMTPHQGSGAGQAMEDGFILAAILAHPNVKISNLPAALKVYDELRRPYSQGVQERSWRTGEYYQLRAPGWERFSEEESAAGGLPRERLDELGNGVKELMRWALEDSIMDQRQEALAMLAQL